MNRVELIKALVGKKSEGGMAKPRGLAHPGEVAVARTRKVRRSGKGYFSSPCFTPIRDMRLKGYLSRAPSDGVQSAACFKAPERREPHHLNRIAEKLKRGWHG